MNAPVNPIPWLAWGGAATLIVVATRNPLYLALVGAAVGVVRLSLPGLGTSAFAWRTVMRIGMAVAVLMVLFNLLTAHAGDFVLFRLPDGLPIVGGPWTLNALVYGAASAGALLDLLLITATFSAVVDRTALLRLLPSQFAAVGVAAIVALSAFPQTLRAMATVREAQLARGFRIRSARDLPPLVVPVLHLGLEHAFDLAETMETRAFGSSLATAPPSRPLLWLALAGAVGAIVAFALGFFLPAALLGIGSGAAGICSFSGGRRSVRGRYREMAWSGADVTVLVAALVSAGLISVAIASSSALVYSLYPRLAWPPFGVIPGLACLLLVAPALLVSRWSRP